MKIINLFCILSSLVTISKASAATFEIIPNPTNKNLSIISISGELELDDENKFAKISKNIKNAMVGFNSLGGNFTAGINIGVQIRNLGYSTAILNGDECSSACAFAWLAGTKRLAGEHAKIGFHAVSMVVEHKRIPSISGNAIAGAYMGKLGLSYDAIAFTVSASPDDIHYLTKAEGAVFDIDFTSVKDDAPEKSLARAFFQTITTVGIDYSRHDTKVCYDNARISRDSDEIVYCIASDYMNVSNDIIVAKRGNKTTKSASEFSDRVEKLANELHFNDVVYMTKGIELGNRAIEILKRNTK